MQANRKLKCKFDKKQTFWNQMERVEKSFNELSKKAQSYTVTGNNPVKIIELDMKKKTRIGFNVPFESLYLVNGIYQPQGDNHSFEALVLTMVKHMPILNKPFGIIYNNVGAYSSTFSDFKKVLDLFPINFFCRLTKIYFLKPTFINKVTCWLTFDTIGTYINQKVINIQTISKLAEETNLSIQKIVQILPGQCLKKLAQDEPDILKFIEKSHPSAINISFNVISQLLKKQVHLQKKKNNFQQSAMIKKLQQNLHSLEQYQLGTTGAPVILQMLICYFNNNEQSLKLQGLFRKSVSIDDQTQILDELNKKNYNFIGTVHDPHLIANTIKKILYKLQIPIIPFDLFQQFMSKDNDPQYVRIVVEGIKKLSKTRLKVIFILFQFLREKVIKYEKQNKMVQNNLCIVFGPCLMRAEKTSFKDLIYAQIINKVTAIIFHQFQTIFGGKEQQVDQKRRSYREHLRLQLKNRQNTELTKNIIQSNAKQICQLGLFDTNEQKLILEYAKQWINQKQMDLNSQNDGEIQEQQILSENINKLQNKQDQKQLKMEEKPQQLFNNDELKDKQTSTHIQI